MNATQIVPLFPPQIDGIGDHALLLAGRLRNVHGIGTSFLVGDPSWRPGEPTGFPAGAVTARSCGALAADLGDADLVMLHYVGYGYQGRGVPHWLVDGLSRWKLAQPSRRLVVMFHELWASGPPWRSEFYLRPIQRRLASRLLRLADASLTSTPSMVRLLDGIVPGRTAFHPIPSNLPAVDPAARRLHRGGPVRVAVFGREGTRLRSVRSHRALLAGLVREGLLAGVDVVGGGARGGPSPSADVGLLLSLVPAALVRVAPDAPVAEAARILAQADLFLSFYPSALVSKSSALTSALACGCVPILTEAADGSALAEGREVLACDGTPASVDRVLRTVRDGSLAPLAEAGWRWQAANASWDAAARRVAGALGGQPRS
jgi:hypothetical protein